MSLPGKEDNILLDRYQGAAICFGDHTTMEARTKSSAISEPGDRAADLLPAERQVLSANKGSRRWVRISPKVSWYGKILIAGALLITFGWQLFHLFITLMTLD
ncbi:hypothetical protein WI560_31250 [Bradyrhizobium sp. A11]|uniref:hypothetical protein n=1 Tax=Bradyrhizobium sp. A11 TaxID=3133974 RepID=UPI0032471129